MPTRSLAGFLFACALVLGTALFIVLPKAPRIDGDLYRLRAAENVWFNADLSRVLSSETDRNGNHRRNKVHPFFSMLTYPVVRLVQGAGGRSALASALLVQEATASCLVLAFMLLLRRLGQHNVDVCLAGLLLATSAAFLFWTVALETYVLGGLSLILALHLLIEPADGRAPGRRRLVAAGLVSFSITITNWVLVLLATVRTLGRKRALRVALVTLTIAAGVTLAQRMFFRGSGLFFVPSSEEARYTHLHTPHILAARIWALGFSTVAAPFPGEVAVNAPGWPLLTMIRPAPGLFEEAPSWTLVAWGCWALLIGLALFSHWRFRGPPVAIQATGVFVALQLVLHAFYGDEPFLYGLHVAPLMILLVGSAYPGQPRPPWATALRRGLILICAGCSFTANGEVFARATTMVADSKREFLASLTEQERTMRFVAAHPDGLSPSGRGHVLFGVPNAGIEDKGYIEPVGVLSPAPRSFGLQVVIEAPDGSLLGSVPAASVGEDQQRIDVDPATRLPVYEGRVPAGTVKISPTAAGRWRVSIERSPSAAGALGFDLRSVGPAGGPITSLVRTTASSLLVNETWRLTWSAPIDRLLTGDESRSSALADDDARVFSSPSGWLRARAFFSPELSHLELQIERTSTSGTKPVDPAPPLVSPGARVPDAGFRRSLAAQTMHLGMSLDGYETRPGDPLNYPYEWLRDGAYVVVALSSSGNVAIAERILADRFHVDYAGGLGAEADAPGLSLWSLHEVYQRGRNRGLVSRLWPDIVRKAALIERCMGRGEAGFRTSASGSPFRDDLKIPADVVCGQPLAGLIGGKMDRHFPLAYVNAVSFAGLTAASRLAGILDERALSLRWAAEAEALRAAWSRALAEGLWAKVRQVSATYSARDLLLGNTAYRRFQQQVASEYLFTFSSNQRFPMSVLWPFGVGWTDEAAVRRILAQQFVADWATTGQMAAGPDWTYFKLATAHQWLLLQDPQKTWRYLEWFWSHQSSPGLYTWAEGKGGAYPDGLWGSTRGWLSNDGGTTPHYWTAAEMLLLQLDMLAYTRDDGTGSPSGMELVIGAGVPDSWKAGEVAVGPIFTSAGKVCWQWRDNVLTVSAADRDSHTRAIGAGAFLGQRVEWSSQPCPPLDGTPPVGPGSSR